jgi:hypothetical protein
MKPAFMKRLVGVEKLLAPATHTVLITDWSRDSKEVREDKLARWRAGEDVPGAPNIADRENAHAILIVAVSPGE